MQVNWTRVGEVLIATPIGRIYSSDYMDWQSELESGIRPDDKKMVVDLGQVVYLSSAGLRVLLVTAKRFIGPDRAFAISRPTRHIGKVLAASGFNSLLPVYDSADAAVAAITEEGQAD